MEYKANTIAGQEYHRFSRIVIDNPKGMVPNVMCVEQSVLTLEGRPDVIRDVGNLGFAFDANESFPLVNPDTGAPTGQTMTGAEVYVAIWSLIMKKAEERDAAILAAQEAQAAAEAKAKVDAEAKAKMDAEAAAAEASNPAE